MVHIFVDFEMNQVPIKSRDPKGIIKSEIIQIGAVKMDEKYHILDIYEAYVRPAYAEICPICRRLTGITQEDVKNAPELPEALRLFLEWGSSQPEETELWFYSWSDNDSRQLLNEARGKLVPEDCIALFSHWIDFQKVYCTSVNQGRMALDIALKGAGLMHVGNKHTALSDALSSAQLLKLVKSPELFSGNRKKRIILNTAAVNEEAMKHRQESRAKSRKGQNPKNSAQVHEKKETGNSSKQLSSR